MKTKIRKDVVLILIGAVLALASFGINWRISYAIDRQLREVNEELQDIDRYLSFASSSILEAFELRSSSATELAISQLMYYQLLRDEPDDNAINAYNSLLANSVIKRASAVTAVHAAATGFTIEGPEQEKVLELSTSLDYALATAELSKLFNNKLNQYQEVIESKVMLRRTLIVTKNQLTSKRSVTAQIAQLVQLLGILIILAKDIVTAKPSGSTVQSADTEADSRIRMAA